MKDDLQKKNDSQKKNTRPRSRSRRKVLKDAVKEQQDIQQKNTDGLFADQASSDGTICLLKELHIKMYRIKTQKTELHRVKSSLFLKKIRVKMMKKIKISPKCQRKIYK